MPLDATRVESESISQDRNSYGLDKQIRHALAEATEAKWSMMKTCHTPRHLICKLM
jgi:hypothetical protein